MTAVDVRLNAIVDPERSGGHDLAELSRRLAEGGATLVQLRDKKSDTRVMIERARAIKAALAPFKVPLVINDRVDVALVAGADGVHVGQSDMTVEDARRLLGPRRHHRAVDQDGRAGAKPRRSNCSTTSVSAASTSRPRRTIPTTPIGLAGLAQHRRRCSAAARGAFPLCAIAGIDAGNAADDHPGRRRRRCR